jgi:ribonuclease HIII
MSNNHIYGLSLKRNTKGINRLITHPIMSKIDLNDEKYKVTMIFKFCPIQGTRLLTNEEYNELVSKLNNQTLINISRL